MKKGFKMLMTVFFALFFVMSDVQVVHASHSWTSSGFVSSGGGNTYTFTTLTNDGDATLLRVSGRVNCTILIDAGTSSANVGNVLWNMGIKKLDYVIITHNDPDHLDGIMTFDRYGIKISNLYLAYPYSKVVTTNMHALDMAKTLFSQGVLTNKATRIMDEEYHSGAENNMNMDSTDTYYLRICRGRLFKLFRMVDEGFDLTIFPPITDHDDWTINNQSMMIVFETDNEKVVFGGDLQATALQDINRAYENNSAYPPERLKKITGDSYSYYYGVMNILFANTSKYTVYKVSHHGTGTNRKLPCPIATACASDQKFMNYLKPDVLIMTGHGTDSQATESAYFDSLRSVTKYRTFSGAPLYK